MPAGGGVAAAYRVLLRLYAFLLGDALVPPLAGMPPAKLKDPPARYVYCLPGVQEEMKSLYSRTSSTFSIASFEVYNAHFALAVSHQTRFSFGMIPRHYRSL